MSDNVRIAGTLTQPLGCQILDHSTPPTDDKLARWINMIIRLMMIRLMLNLYKTITTSVYLFKYVKSSIYNKFMFRMLVLSAPNEKWVKNSYELNLWGGKMEVNVKFYMNVTIISVFRKMFYPQTILLYIRMNTCRLQRVTKSFFTVKCDALRDLVPLVQFKNREKHPWRSVNFSKVASWSLQVERFNLQINTPQWMFFTFFKLCKWYQIAQRTTNV